MAPIARDENVQLAPDDLRAMLAYIRQHRTAAEPFDVVLGGRPLAREQYAAYADAGVTWYQDSFTWEDRVDTVRAHIRRGPPQH